MIHQTYKHQLGHVTWLTYRVLNTCCHPIAMQRVQCSNDDGMKLSIEWYLLGHWRPRKCTCTTQDLQCQTLRRKVGDDGVDKIDYVHIREKQGQPFIGVAQGLTALKNSCRSWQGMSMLCHNQAQWPHWKHTRSSQSGLVHTLPLVYLWV